jgi:hypothetical protein
MNEIIINLLVLMSIIGCAPKGKPPQMVDGRVRFTFHSSHSQRVYIYINSEGRGRTDIMTWHENGMFTADISLPVGFHAYQFQIDHRGSSIDHNNPAMVTKSHTGEQLSVIYVNDIGEVELRTPLIGIDDSLFNTPCIEGKFIVQ